MWETLFDFRITMTKRSYFMAFCLILSNKKVCQDLLVIRIPSAEFMEFNTKRIKNLSGHMVDHILNSFRMIIVCLHWRHDNSTHFGKREHVPQD